MSNRLKNEKSPYLLQHGDNPVDWYPWCEEAFERAKREDRPVFLSIGYSTCHWCHVMAHESFEDEEVARFLNQEFVCVKVDREERPDIDAVYMSVCQAVTGSGGWPLTIIMTPEQKPFFAGTYFPKQHRYGQPGLLDILKSVADLWKKEKEELRITGAEIAAAVCERRITAKKEPGKALLEKAYDQFRRQYDGKWGGFGSAPKFPTPHNLLFLMEYSFLENVPEAAEMAEETLEAMARGGIHDHIGGGFSRYSTDEKWLIPHFEKMLYDNALLILAYLKAYQITEKEAYKQVVRSTADYILRELKDEKGGFYCGQDADSEGVEGKYYSFTKKEVLSVLGEEDGQEFCRLYGITERGNFQGESIPNRIGQREEGWQQDDLRLKKLYEYRMNRTRLHKDKKCLLSWNAWTILALARAGWALSEERYLNGACQAEKFMEACMRDEKGRLYLRFCDGEAAHLAQLEDYGVYALAMTELYRITFRAEYLEKAVKAAECITELFWDEKGGYYMTPKDAGKLILRPRETYDGAIPSGNSVAAMVFLELAALTGNTKWQEAAGGQLAFLAGEAEEYPAGHSFALLSIIKAFSQKRELLCAVKDKVPEELTEYLRKNSQNELYVLVKTAQNAKVLSECAPFTEHYPLPERGAVYYLCENGACRQPVTDFKELVVVH